MKRLLPVLLFIICFPLFSVDYLSDESDYVDVYFEKPDDGGYIFYADNRHFIPQYISLGFTLKKPCFR